MEVHFFGAAQTVTGSQHLLKVNGHSLLLDCGMFQGRRQESYERNQNLPFDGRRVDATILSHAHIDHSGNLPNLVKCGFRGPIYCTEATAHLSNLMLMDAAHIQEADVEFVNKKRRQRGEPPIEPLYTQEDAGRVATFFRGMDYDQAFEAIPGVTARLVDAGHILGSAGVALDIEEKVSPVGMRKFRLWFSGDIGRRKLPLLRDPVLPVKADYVIMESTYGDKPHRDPQAAFEELRQVSRQTFERGGKVIIPAFAVGRTQELVYYFHQMIDNREIPSIPVYVDSPLAVNVSQVYKDHPECFDAETGEFLRTDRHKTVLGFDRLVYVRSVEESKSLNGREGPMVIISASGMAETGRILHHLKNNIEDPRNTILIISWQAPYTLGRRLADREWKVRIFGEEYLRKAEVATIGGFSAHAGQDMLVEYALATRDQVKEVFLVHGEAKAAGALREKLLAAGVKPVTYPQLGERVEI